MIRVTILISLLSACGGAAFSSTIDAPPPDAAAPITVSLEAGEEGDAANAVAPPDALSDVALETSTGEATLEATLNADAEAPLDASSDVAPEEAAREDVVSCTLITHSNGLGATWQDCVPGREPMRACELAKCGACTGTDAYGGTCCVGGVSCTCWDPDGHVRGGTWPSGNSCSASALATEDTWQ